MIKKREQKTIFEATVGDLIKCDNSDMSVLSASATPFVASFCL